MKIHVKRAVALTALALLVLGTPAIANAARADLAQPNFASTQASPSATNSDAAGLLLMAEEERMAHDLYVAFGEEWGSRKFSNISRAEIQHHNLVLDQLERLGVPAPDAFVPGQYNNSELQALYDEWLERGMISQQEAFAVGAELERRDIADLEKVKAQTDDPELNEVYQRLIDGSERHLAAFERGGNGGHGWRGGDSGDGWGSGGHGWRGGRG